MSLRGVAAHLALVLAPLAIVLGLAEASVRSTHADESCPNRFTGLPVWACDPILQFKLNPELDVLGQKLSRAGFRTHEFAPKRPGVYRILALGDSCTFGQLQRGELYGYVSNPYPLALEKLLADRVGPGRFEVFNAGIPGYNSYQGLMLLRGKLRGPRSRSDHGALRLERSLPVRGAAGPGSVSRVRSRMGGCARGSGAAHGALPLRAATRFRAERLARAEPRRAAPGVRAARSQWSPTIPLAEYEHNLRRIVEIGRARGAQVWLLTAPYNPTPSEKARNFVAFNNKLGFDELMAEHERYNEATRAVGRELGVPVIDMDAIYRDNPDVRLFLESDVLHPSQWGHHLEADVLYRALVARGIAAPKSAVAPGKIPGA